VVLATDAMTDVDPAAHENSVERIFPRLGERATTAEVLAMLEAARTVYLHLSSRILDGICPQA
jgi:isochorismate hydrolase